MAKVSANQTAAAPVDRIAAAVVRRDGAIGERLLDRAFALAFRGLVYAQIWEDPAVDMAALELAPDHRMVTIASGGCNALSYLVADPAEITAVDLNTAHVALNRLKIAAVRHLPDHEHLRRFFVEADSPANNVTETTVEAWTSFGATSDRFENFFLTRYAAAYAAEPEHFADILAGRTKPLVSIADGLEALRLAVAAKQSAESGTMLGL